ncbi:hypothetical protein PGB90_008692 [Kerria lacca]
MGGTYSLRFTIQNSTFHIFLQLLKEISNSKRTESPSRPKRTIGFLRQLFPGLSQIIDRKIQYITRILFRVVGRLILRGGNGGGGASGSGDGNGSGRKVSITLPTYPPIDDEEETELPTEKESSSSESSSPTIDVRVGSTDQSFAASDQASTTSKDNVNASSSSSVSSTELNSATDAQEANTILRKVRDIPDIETTVIFDDELSSTESSTRRQGFLWRLGEMRKKRGSFGTTTSGSGNFLLDLVRLIAGSGISPEKDEELNAPRDERDENSVDATEENHPSSSDNSEDQYSAGIPGPLTRLFILANRGISSLIQDIIILCPDTVTNCKRRSSVVVNYVANEIDDSS